MNDDLFQMLVDSFEEAIVGKVTLHCTICKRKLDQPDDPKSLDCGGDCWGCMEEFEKPDDGA